jgi:hypothetical protein
MSRFTAGVRYGAAALAALVWAATVAKASNQNQSGGFQIGGDVPAICAHDEPFFQTSDGQRLSDSNITLDKISSEKSVQFVLPNMMCNGPGQRIEIIYKNDSASHADKKAGAQNSGVRYSMSANWGPLATENDEPFHGRMSVFFEPQGALKNDLIVEVRGEGEKAPNLEELLSEGVFQIVRRMRL